MLLKETLKYLETPQFLYLEYPDESRVEPDLSEDPDEEPEYPKRT